jgi:hypothetical protein
LEQLPELMGLLNTIIHSCGTNKQTRT